MVNFFVQNNFELWYLLKVIFVIVILYLVGGLSLRNSEYFEYFDGVVEDLGFYLGFFY